MQAVRRADRRRWGVALSSGHIIGQASDYSATERRVGPLVAPVALTTATLTSVPLLATRQRLSVAHCPSVQKQPTSPGATETDVK